ncbi:MAG: hypothetical protein QXL69_01635 [Candidatus Bathyarchaeia archaeon]
MFEIENAVFAFFHEGKIKIGTLALALPKIEPSISSIIMGDKFTVTARILAEKLALKFNKIAFTSIAVNNMESEILKTCIELLNKI